MKNFRGNVIKKLVDHKPLQRNCNKLITVVLPQMPDEEKVANGDEQQRQNESKKEHVDYED